MKCATDDWKPAREVKTSSDSIRFGHGQISHKLSCRKKVMEFILAFSLGLVKEIYLSISSGKLNLDVIYVILFAFWLKL